MKAFLMYPDRDFDGQWKALWNEQNLIQDLELNALFNAMAAGDPFVHEVAKRAVLSSVREVETILYRQAILQDCLSHPSVIREIYRIAGDALEREKQHYWITFRRTPGSVLYSSVVVLETFVSMLQQLKAITDQQAHQFVLQGLTRFFAMLKCELSEDYFTGVHHHLRQLQFRHGVLMSAELGKSNKGDKYVLHQLPDQKPNWLLRIFGPKATGYTYTLHPRDETGARALSDLRDRGINLVANAVAQSADHIHSFFHMLRQELAFYVGGMNLHAQLAQKGMPLCFPLPLPAIERKHVFQGLYDACLSLSMERRVVGNDGRANRKDLVIITGANEGGKTTFLRSIGLAQLMMQCGMFVPAESFRANLCTDVFTHYKREEDVTMESGKFAEELSRMSEIVDHLTPGALVLLNESFAATNEREGSEIARQIISALVEHRVQVFFVTHLYELARWFHDKHTDNAMFLRAERLSDGRRTFKIIEGEPLQTSYGPDLYRRIFHSEQTMRNRP